MTDLYVAFGLVGIASVIAFILAIRWKLSRKAATFWIVAGIWVVVAFRLVLQDEPVLTKFVPLASAIVLANPLPIVAAFVAGLAWRQLPGSAWRRSVFPAGLFVAGLWASYGMLLGNVPPLANKWQNGVCRQTSSASCSPAAAATLLKVYGIDTTEDEMARLCFTREGGTLMMGLYRGLMLKTRGTPWTVETFTTTPDQLQMDAKGPALLTVMLRPHADVDPRYQSDWGWTPGVKHSVVYFGPGHGTQIEVGDPNVGREEWDMKGLRVLWTGQALRLVRR